MTVAVEPLSPRQKLNDREDVARRLLASAARKSYDPLIEVDWDAPVDHTLYGMTPEWCSLYGTP
ncbi:MAG: diiron oxygenase, partial [Gordonia paraffinivorans]